MTTLALAYVLGVIATARLTRLTVHDDWPPIRGLRLRWVQWQDTRDYNAAGAVNAGERHSWRHGWSTLLTCPFCFAPYAAAVVLLVAVLTGVWGPGWSWESVWWVSAVWASGAYLAAILVAYDEPAE